MFYYKFIAETPYCGTEGEKYVCSKEKLSQTELDEMSEEFVRENAKGYEYLVTGWDDEYTDGMSEDEIYELIENYYANCSGSWEEITKEEVEENTYFFSKTF